MGRLAMTVAVLIGVTMQVDVASAAPDALDTVLAQYQTTSGKVDWKRLRRDLAARKRPSGGAAAKLAVAPNAAYAQLPATPPPAPGTTARPEGVLLLRSAYSAQTFISEQSDLSDDGASISFTRNNLAGTDTIAGKGALFYALHQWVPLQTTNPNDIAVSHYSVVPGVEWDIKSQRKTGEMVGAASVLLGSEFLLRGPVLDMSYLKARASYTSDVSTGAAQVYGSDLSWAPVLLERNVGTRNVYGPYGLAIGFYPTLDASYVHVGAEGAFANLVTGRDYFWVGPHVNADLGFKQGWLERFRLNLEYYYLYDTLRGGYQNIDYGVVSLTTKLGSWQAIHDPTQTADVSFVVRYTGGKSPRTLEKNGETFAGLTLKLGDLGIAKTDANVK